MIDKFDAFIFDIDGTLAVTNELIFASFNHVTQKYLNIKYSPQEIIQFFGPPEDVILKEIMKDKYEDARIDYYNFYEDFHNQFVKPIELINLSIKHLKKLKMKLGIFTGKGQKSSEITLNKLGLIEYFDMIKTGDNVEFHKPHPDGINQFIEYYNLDRNKVLMLGDSTSDIQAAKSAGVKSAAFMWDCYSKEDVENSDADYYFYSPKEFYNTLLKKMPLNEA